MFINQTPNRPDTMNNSDVTLHSEATIRKPEPEPERISQPQPEFPLRLDVMYDGVHYIFKSTEEMMTHIAFLERKKKIIQRVRERHQNSQMVVDVE
jgi:hypothetical protein